MARVTLPFRPQHSPQPSCLSQRLNTSAKDKLSTSLHEQGLKWHVMCAYPSIPSSLTCLHRPGCFRILVLSPIADFRSLVTLCTSLYMFDASAAFPKLSTTHMYHFFAPIVVFAPIQMLCAYLHMLDIFKTLPSLCGSSARPCASSRYLRLQCSAHACVYPTRLFGFRASLAHLCAILCHWQVNWACRYMYYIQKIQ